MAIEPARVSLLSAILSLVLSVTFEHTAACRILALALSPAIYFAMKRSVFGVEWRVLISQAFDIPFGRAIGSGKRPK